MAQRMKLACGDEIIELHESEWRDLPSAQPYGTLLHELAAVAAQHDSNDDVIQLPQQRNGIACAADVAHEVRVLCGKEPLRWDGSDDGAQEWTLRLQYWGIDVKPFLQRTYLPLLYQTRKRELEEADARAAAEKKARMQTRRQQLEEEMQKRAATVVTLLKDAFAAALADEYWLKKTEPNLLCFVIEKHSKDVKVERCGDYYGTVVTTLTNGVCTPSHLHLAASWMSERGCLVHGLTKGLVDHEAGLDDITVLRKMQQAVLTGLRQLFPKGQTHITRCAFCETSLKSGVNGQCDVVYFQLCA